MRKFIKITTVSGSFVIFHRNASFCHFGAVLKVDGWLEGSHGKLKFIKVSTAYTLHSAPHGWSALHSIKSGKNWPTSSIACVFQGRGAMCLAQDGGVDTAIIQNNVSEPAVMSKCCKCARHMFAKWTNKSKSINAHTLTKWFSSILEVPSYWLYKMYLFKLIDTTYSVTFCGWINQRLSLIESLKRTLGKLVDRTSANHYQTLADMVGRRLPQQHDWTTATDEEIQY